MPARDWAAGCALGRGAPPAWSVHPPRNGGGAEDVEDVKFVINFDYPNSSEDYVHRIGRTGRSQRTGTAYTFFTQSNLRQAADLMAVLTEANQVINPKLLELAEMCGGGGGGGRGGRNRYRAGRRGGGGAAPRPRSRTRSRSPSPRRARSPRPRSRSRSRSRVRRARSRSRSRNRKSRSRSRNRSRSRSRNRKSRSRSRNKSRSRSPRRNGDYTIGNGYWSTAVREK